MGRPVGKPTIPIATLAIRWNRGDEASGNALVKRLRSFVNWRVKRVMGTTRRRRPVDMPDIRADGMFAALRATRSWRYGHMSLRNFICPAVDEEIRRGLRRTRRLPEIPPANPHSFDAPLTSAMAVLTALNHLDPATKKIVRWCLLDPDPIPIGYAAKALGVSKATAERRLAAGAAALTNLLS